MNNTEALLLALAIVILLGLIIYSVLLSSRASKRKAASQAESLKLMLEEYAKNVREEQREAETELPEIDVEIPTKQYPKFDNSRAVTEMGMSQEEADSLVLELIKAIEVEIPRVEEALKTHDIRTIEEVIHTITGSSSTLGSGGVSSALISFYAAVQHRDVMEKLRIHLENVKYYLASLKEENGVA